jgi:hypothetical protein
MDLDPTKYQEHNQHIFSNHKVLQHQEELNILTFQGVVELIELMMELCVLDLKLSYLMAKFLLLISQVVVIF